MARRCRYTDDDVWSWWDSQVGRVQIMSHIIFNTIRGKQTKDTLSDVRVRRLVLEYMKLGSLTIDPFARDCTLAYPYTNDIDPNTRSVYNMDALDFIELFDFDWFDMAIMDPPFSNRQDNEVYGNNNLYTNPRKIRDIELALGNRVRSNGCVIKFGYNSNFSHRGFELDRIMLVRYGGSINDMIISVHKKYTRNIRSYKDE